MFLIKEGHVILIGCLVLLYFSYRQMVAGKYIGAGLLMMCAAWLLRIYICADLYLYAWDERYHALVAKNMWLHPLKPTLYEHPLYQHGPMFWTRTHVWLHKQPMTMWMMMFSIKLFGANEWGVRIPSIIMGGLTAWFTYRTGARMLNEKTGWWAGALMSLLALPVLLGSGQVHTDHVDMCFLFFITAAMYAGVRGWKNVSVGWLLGAGVLMGCAILTKWLPGLIVLGVCGIYGLGQTAISWPKRLLWMFLPLLPAVLVAAPWQWYIMEHYTEAAQWEYTFSNKHFYEVIEGHIQPWYHHVEALIKGFSVFGLVAVPVFIFVGIKQKKYAETLALVAWYVVPLVFFSIAKTRLIAYTAFGFPAVAMMCGYVIVYLTTEVKQKVSGWLITGIFITTFLLHTIDWLQLSMVRARKHIEMEKVKRMRKEKRDKPLAIFGTPYPVEAMFYLNNCVAYEGVADKHTIDSLLQEGYIVRLYNDSTLLYDDVQPAQPY